MNVPELIIAVADRNSFGTIDDAKLRRRIATAVAFYSRYNPDVRTYAFETVAQSGSYELPAGCIDVRECAYVTTGTLAPAIATLESDYSFSLYSQRVIETIKKSERARYSKSSFTKEGRQIILLPTPSRNGDAVVLKYTAAHKVEADGEDYPTIPDIDFDLIADLALAELLEVMRLAASVLPNYTEGLTEIKRGHIPASARIAVADLRAKCIAKYTSPTVLI